MLYIWSHRSTNSQPALDGKLLQNVQTENQFLSAYHQQQHLSALFQGDLPLGRIRFFYLGEPEPRCVSLTMDICVGEEKKCVHILQMYCFVTWGDNGWLFNSRGPNSQFFCAPKLHTCISFTFFEWELVQRREVFSSEVHFPFGRNK